MELNVIHRENLDTQAKKRETEDFYYDENSHLFFCFEQNRSKWQFNHVKAIVLEFRLGV